jgi:hypothetical protein
MDDMNFFFEGLYEVEFTNGETREIDVMKQIVDREAHPLWLVCATGKIYNWMNIISVRKK